MPAKSQVYTRNPGHFLKVQSGNPAGRPRGARNKATLAVEALLGGKPARLTREVVEHALDSGDPGLLRFCLVRLLPPARRRRAVLDLAAGSDAGDVVASLAATVRAVAAGVISPLEASDVAKAMKARCRPRKTLDLGHVWPASKTPCERARRA
jgi:hypothetical protein